MKKLLILTVTMLIVGSTPATAAVSIPVENFSFELPGTIKQACWDGEKSGSTDIPGWTDGPAIAHDSGVERDTAYGSTEPNSTSWAAFLENADTPVWNLVNHIISSGEQFTLQIDLKDNWKNTTACSAIISLYYDNAGTRVPVASTTVTPLTAYSTFSLEFAADSDPNSFGHQLGIEIDNVSASPGSSWIGIDNVRLESPTIWKAWNPNPPIDSMTASSGVVLRWNAGANAASVNGHRVYLDLDMQKVIARSGCTVNGVSSTDVSYTVSGLTSGGTYYWAIDEVNDTNVWSGNTWSFQVPVLTAINPTPADGAQRVIRELELLQWKPGSGCF